MEIRNGAEWDQACMIARYSLPPLLANRTPRTRLPGCKHFLHFFVKNKLIEYSFGDRAAHVEFAESPNGVRVCVTFDSEPTHSMEQQRDGWQAILNNFTRHVEAGR